MSDKILKWQNGQLDSTNYTVTIGDVITQDNIDDILNYKYCGYNSFFNDITRLTEYTDIKYAERGQKFNPDLFPPLYGAVANGYIPSQNAISDSLGFVPYEAAENMARPYWFVSFIATKDLNISNGWLRYNSINFSGNVFFVKEIKGIKKCFISKYKSTKTDGDKITYDYIDRHATLSCTCDRDLTSSIAANYLKEDGNSTEYYIYPVLVIVVNNNIYMRTCEIISPANVECHDYRYYKPIGASLPFKDINAEYLWFETNHGFTEITTTKTFTSNGTMGTTLENAEIVPNKIVDDLHIYKYITYSGLLTANNAYDNDDNIAGYYNIIFGLYVKDDTTGDIIKPIISEGIVTGWSSDLSADSDIDKWNTSIDHDVPLKPTETSADSDSETDMEIGSLYSASGMVHYYKVTSENLQMLSKLMSNVDVVGTKNLLPNLISLKAFPISFDRLGRGTIKTIEIGGVKMTDNIAGTATGITVDSTYGFLECCDTTVQGKYGNISNPHFLDFSPYTQVELILPLAGSVILPDNAMYKSLSVVYVYDIVNGSAICVVKSNGTVISTIPCTLSQDVPFSAINVGTKTSAMISNITNVAQNIATLGVSIGTGNLVGGISSGISTVGSISQTVMSNNQNYIEKFGRNGDMCDFGLVKKAYIKYTRPVDIIPENFGRTNGYLCNVTKKLSDCSGFTICENPEINCSGTETEKQRIKQLLETGVYI